MKIQKNRRNTKLWIVVGGAGTYTFLSRREARDFRHATEILVSVPLTPTQTKQINAIANKETR